MLLNMEMFKVTICDFGKMNINMTDNKVENIIIEQSKNRNHDN